MGMRELVILLLILAIIGIILRGLYLALRARRNELKMALEKNVPVYDLNEIELRELPNGGARVVERSFAHVQAQNQRFSPRKNKRPPSIHAVSANSSARKTATSAAARSSGSSASSKAASNTAGHIPVLMNPIPAKGTSAASAERMQARTSTRATPPPPVIDDMISSLESDLDEQLDEHGQAQAYEQGHQREHQADSFKAEQDENVSPPLIEVELRDEDAQSEETAMTDNEPPVLTEPIVPETIETEIFADADQSQVPEAWADEPWADEESPDSIPMEEPVLNEVTAQANPEADGHYDDDTETNDDSYDADQNIEEKSYDEITDPDEIPEEAVISTERKDDILGNIDDAEIDFDEDDRQQRAGLAEEKRSGSTVGRLMGWAGSKLRLGNRSQSQDERAPSRDRERDQTQDEDILFDAPLNSGESGDDIDVGVGQVRESPRGRAAALAERRAAAAGANRARTAQPQDRRQQRSQSARPEPQQQSLLNMENEGAPAEDDPSLYEEPNLGYGEAGYAQTSHDEIDQEDSSREALRQTSASKFDRSVPKSQSQAEKAQAARAKRAQADADAEAEAARQNNNIAPDYSEVLIVNVMARGNSVFAGVDLLPALLSCGLRLGEMSIFHRHVDERGNGPVLFSVANIVNPGTFDLNTISDFETRGVCFFLTLPNVINNMQAFDRMIDTAQKLRSTLDGELKDDNRSVMTAQTIEHYRQRVRDFELRQLRQQ